MAYTLQKESPIAVFDSGLGGISVLRELVKVMPNEDYIYLGDSANAPYGTKSLEEVRALTLGHAKDFFDEGVKGIVVACNTATSAAVKKMREMYPEIPIVGIEPALKPAANSGEHPRVLVMGTPMTIREEKFRRLMAKYEEQATIYPVPCPGLMEFVEEGELESERLETHLRSLLGDYIGKTDAVVLGCTHYPFVIDMVARIMGPEVTIFDGGNGTAREMRRRLMVAGLLTEKETPGTIEFRNSLNDPEKQRLCRFLMER